MANEIVPSTQPTSAITLSEEDMKALQSAPAIKEKMDQLAALALNTSAAIAELQQAGIWRRVFSNNTKDLATAIGKVLYLQCACFDMLYILIRANANNIFMLNTIKNEMTVVNAKLLKSAETDDSTAQNIVAVRGAMTSMTGLLDHMTDKQLEQQRQTEQFKKLSIISISALVAGVGSLLIFLIQYLTNR